MSHLRQNIHEIGLEPVLIHHELGEPNKLRFLEYPDKDAPLQVRRGFVMDLVKGFPIVRECSTLAHRTLVVDLPDSTSQFFVEGNLSNCQTLLSCLLGAVARFHSYLMAPPVIEGGKAQDSQVIPFHRVG